MWLGFSSLALVCDLFEGLPEPTVRETAKAVKSSRVLHELSSLSSLSLRKAWFDLKRPNRKYASLTSRQKVPSRFNSNMVLVSDSSNLIIDSTSHTAVISSSIVSTCPTRTPTRAATSRDYSQSRNQ